MFVRRFRPGEKISFPSLRAALPVVLVAAFISGCGSVTQNTDPESGPPAVSPVTEHGNNPATMHMVKAEEEPRAEPNQVLIDNFRFNPQKLTVAVGTKVTWVNRDDVPHTATSNVRPRLFDSRTLDTDDKFAHVFTTPGTYEYFCAVHPHMIGQIIVK